MTSEMKSAIEHTLDKNFKEGDKVLWTINGRTGTGVVKELIDEKFAGHMRIKAAIVEPDDGTEHVRIPRSLMFHAE